MADRVFENLDPAVKPDLQKALKWGVIDRIAGRRRKAPPSAPIPRVEAVTLPDSARGGALWLGHATALLRLGGAWIITDPVFSPKLGLFPRNGAPPLDPALLPPLDLILISHNHRDHLDKPSIQTLERRDKPRYLVPLGVDRYLTAWGVDPARITSLDWWQEARPLEPRSPLRVALVPAQHWSQRTALDRNTSLWGGFVLQDGDRSVYFAGDSGYFEGFALIGARFPGLDLALLPIGAYDPEWFMRPQHMNPEEAGRAFLDLGAAHMISIHWGTYKLTDEPLDEPPARLEGWRAAQRLEPERVHTLPLGGRLSF